MCKHEYVNYQNKLYYIYRKVNSNRIKEQFVQEIKDFWSCDIVLKYANQENTDFLFLREVPELEVSN
jgi:hypothetical protein